MEKQLLELYEDYVINHNGVYEADNKADADFLWEKEKLALLKLTDYVLERMETILRNQVHNKQDATRDEKWELLFSTTPIHDHMRLMISQQIKAVKSKLNGE